MKYNLFSITLFTALLLIIVSAVRNYFRFGELDYFAILGTILFVALIIIYRKKITK